LFLAVSFPSRPGRLGLAVLLALLFGHGALARADQVRTILVPREGGAYTIEVHPDVLTVLYFPAEVIGAYSIQEPPQMILAQHARTVTVQPRPGVRHATAAVATEAFRVGLLFQVVEHPEQAVIQVDFRPLAFEQEIERRAAHLAEQRWQEAEVALERERAALAQARAELARREARLQALIQEAALEHIAEGLRTHHRSVSVASGARLQHVAMRIRRVVWIGANAYIWFAIENRRRTPYLLDAVELSAAGLEQPTHVSFPAPPDAAARGILGVVPARDRQHGVAVLRDASAWIGETITIRVSARQVDAPADAAPLSASFILRD
jgi:hypothetical protein